MLLGTRGGRLLLGAGDHTVGSKDRHKGDVRSREREVEDEVEGMGNMATPHTLGTLEEGEGVGRRERGSNRISRFERVLVGFCAAFSRPRSHCHTADSVGRRDPALVMISSVDCRGHIGGPVHTAEAKLASDPLSALHLLPLS